MSIENIQDYSGLTFSFKLTPQTHGANYTYSVYYENTGGDLVQLFKKMRSDQMGEWNVSYDLTGDHERRQ